MSQQSLAFFQVICEANKMYLNIWSETSRCVAQLLFASLKETLAMLGHTWLHSQAVLSFHNVYWPYRCLRVFNKMFVHNWLTRSLNYVSRYMDTLNDAGYLFGLFLTLPVSFFYEVFNVRYLGWHNHMCWSLVLTTVRTKAWIGVDFTMFLKHDKYKLQKH